MGPDSGRVARLRKQVADLERQLAEAAGDRRRREAEALAHSARFLTETLDVETVGRRIVQSVCGLFEVSAAGLRLREPDGSLVLVAASDGDGPYMPIGHVAPPGFGFYGRIVDSGRPLRLPDMLAAPATVLDADVLRRLRGSRQRSLLAVPLRVQERITGVLSVAAATGRVFSDDEVRLLQAFADQAALALENSRSHAEVLQRRREAEELARVSGLVSETLDLASVGERIADAVLRLLDVNSSAIASSRPSSAGAPVSPCCRRCKGGSESIWRGAIARISSCSIATCRTSPARRSFVCSRPTPAPGRSPWSSSARTRFRAASGDFSTAACART